MTLQSCRTEVNYVGRKKSLSNIVVKVTRIWFILCLLLIHIHNHWYLVALSLNNNCTFSAEKTLNILKACRTEILVMTNSQSWISGICENILEILFWRIKVWRLNDILSTLPSISNNLKKRQMDKKVKQYFSVRHGKQLGSWHKNIKIYRKMRKIL